MDRARIAHYLRTLVLALALLGGIVAGGQAAAGEPLNPPIDATAPVGAVDTIVVDPASDHTSHPRDVAAVEPSSSGAIAAGGQSAVRQLLFAFDEINYCLECAGYA
jgi:hypothetical protein